VRRILSGALLLGAVSPTQRAVRFDSDTTLVYVVRSADFTLKNKTFLTILATPRFHINVENSEKKC
jgi:hypothetical protein